MALTKYASAKIAKIGSLDDVLNDMDGQTRDRAMVHVAALLPVARCLDDYIYLRSWAVSSGEIYGANDNLDYFPKDELLKSYATFINTGFYKDHANYNVKLAYGINLDAVYTPKDFVAVISAIKKAGLQKDQEWLVEQIKLGKVDQVSMGCQVEESTCSECGNKATNVGQYCDCLQNARMMRHACLTGECPECQTPESMCKHVRAAAKMGITLDKIAKSSRINGHPLYEINRGCTFFDLSAITTVAADRNARIAEVIDKQASSNGMSLVDFIRPSVKVACVQADGEGKETCCSTGGNTMAANLEKEAAEKNKNPQLKNQVDGGNPMEMTDAGDYPQKDGRPEDLMLKRDKATGPASKKEHEIRERAQHDAGDYGPGGRGTADPKEPTPQEFAPESVDVHGKKPGVVSDADVNKYRADAAKGVSGLGKEAHSDAGFMTELKSFFQGLLSKKAEETKSEEKPAEPIKPVPMDEVGLEEVRASLRDDMESLQEASDKLHDETLKMVSKASTAPLATIAKRAEAEVENYKALNAEIEAARRMVEGALSETKGYLEAAAKKGGVGKEAVAALKEAAAEVRGEVDVVLDKVVVAVTKAAGPAPMISPGTVGGPKPGGMGDG